MPVVEVLALALAACAAGMINAIAGGGTLITFPALLFFGTSSIVANATSTLALVIGTAGSVYGYRKQIDAVKPWLRRFIPVSLVGGLLGSILLTHLGEQLFSKLVPFLILFATILFLTQGTFRKYFGVTLSTEGSAPHRQALGAALVFQFLVSVYGGYFGAGMGILMLASMGCLGMSNIHEMNTVKTIVGSLINAVAAVYFIFSGLIDWPKMFIMTAGALIGYFIGAHYSQRISQQAVRRIITTTGLIISGALFYKKFVR